MIHEPAAHLSDHLLIIIEGRDDEVCQLYMYARLMEDLYGVEDRLQMSAAILLVKLIGEIFQIDIGGIGDRRHLLCWLRICIAGSDEDIPKTVLMGKDGGVIRILIPCQWLGIGIGDARTVVTLADFYELTGRNYSFRRLPAVGRSLGDLEILTVFTAEITAHASHRQTLCARVKLRQWLLLHGVDGEGAGMAVDEGNHLSAFILSYPTDARLTLSQMTVMGTEITTDAAVG